MSLSAESKMPGAENVNFLRLNAWNWVALVIVAVLISAPIILLGREAGGLIVLGASAYLLLAAASLKEPLLYIAVFLSCLIVLPPVYLPRFHGLPIYAAALLLPIGVGIIALRLTDFQLQLDPVFAAFSAFVFFAGISLPFAWLYSGGEVGLGSLLRWLMLADVVLIYVIARGGMRSRQTHLETQLIKVLFGVAVVSATYGIIDFVRPVPIPHPAADQYIWLGKGMLRRAQGVFFEASSFADMCGFFLAAASAAFLTGAERAVRLSKAWLLFVIPVLALAVLVSFSRSAWACIATTVVVFGILFERVRIRRLPLFLIAVSLPLILLLLYSPELWNYFLANRVGHFAQIFSDPNFVTSGRIDVWRRIAGVLQERPEYFIFGVGYKSLPRTRLFHQGIVADNAFLGLLLETGVAGLSSFVLFLAAVFRCFWRLAHSPNAKTAFWSGFLFSFWCGECVQFMAADAYTYWRNIGVVLVFMGIVMTWAQRETYRKSGGLEAAIR